MGVAAGVRYNPTYTENLAEIVCELAQAGAHGIYHVVGADRILRVDFAKRAARAFGLDAALIEAVPADRFKAPARRPKESSLRTYKVRSLVKTRPWGVDEGLSHMAAFEPEWKSYAERTPAQKL